MWRYAIPVAIFAVLFGFLFVGLNRDPSYVPSPLIGKHAPAIAEYVVDALAGGNGREARFSLAEKLKAGRGRVL